MMNKESIAPTDARKGTLLVFSVTALALGVLFFFGLRPLYIEREAMHLRLNELEHELAPYLRRARDFSLEAQVAAEKENHQQLRGEIDRLLGLLHTFRAGSPLMAMIPSPEEGRIDFKVALFNARTILSERASATGMALPSGLGMEEAIAAAEDAETRLWQLAAVVRLVEHGIQLELPAIEMIRPAKPIIRPLIHQQYAVLREYPVRLRCRGSYEQLLRFVGELESKDQFFTLRRFRIERTDWRDEEALTMEIVCGAGLPRRGEALPVEEVEEDETMESAPVSGRRERTSRRAPDSVRSPFPRSRPQPVPGDDSEAYEPVAPLADIEEAP